MMYRLIPRSFLVLAAFALFFAILPAAPARAATTTCHYLTCDAKSPVATGCYTAFAGVYASKNILKAGKIVGKLQLYGSAQCEAYWTVVRSSIGNQTIQAEIYRYNNDGGLGPFDTKQVFGTSVSTTMLGSGEELLKACGWVGSSSYTCLTY